MAISRMNMERQMRNMGGIMSLEDQRQGYFLGKLVRKAKKAVKKVIKSPIGKAALLAGGAYLAGGFMPGGGGLTGGFANFKNLGSGIGSLFGQGGKFSTLGDIFRVGGKAGEAFSVPRILGGLAGAGAIAAPFLMSGGEEEVDEGTPVTMAQPMVEDIREQARKYYQDPTKSALYFMPPKSAVRFGGAFAGGGLADIPREGYENGSIVLSEDELAEMGGLKGLELKLLAEKFMKQGMSESAAYEKAAKKLYADGGRVGKAEGGLMDLGGMEKDYREGGFVPIGEEERADDVPARLSKNEFVFTADAVRNAGGGDIDKGAEVMQNMMDNLEAGGNISEESQGKENPAQAMFDQAQQLESRIV